MSQELNDAIADFKRDWEDADRAGLTGSRVELALRPLLEAAWDGGYNQWAEAPAGEQPINENPYRDEGSN